MFAAPVGKIRPTAATQSAASPAPRCSAVAAVRRSRGRSEAWRGVAGDFSKVPPLPPGRAIAADASPSPGRPRVPQGLQRKLMVGSASDPLEHEADRVAEKVMRMPTPLLPVGAGPVRLGRKCAACDEAARTLHAKPTATPGDATGEAPDIVHDVLRSPGQPLDAGTRGFFEPRFGRDFSQIRVHTDAPAALSARHVGALAYAAGSHIAFASGQYAPGTESGKALLAHELAHTLQQTGGSAADGVLSRRVASVRCPANQFGAPDDPRAALETADQTAIDLANQMAQGLAADAQTVRGGIPDTPSATLQAFENHFGLPVAVGAGFLNRLAGIVRPTQALALSEELSVVARRFALVARVMSQGLSYNCPGNAALGLVGCTPRTCVGIDAFSCPGNSLVALCASFWSDFDDTARAQILIHESLHIALGNIGIGSILDATTSGAGRNFNIAGCYEATIADGTGADSHESCPDVPAG
jgi:Domain of unknown function (DUF4157)